MQHYIPRSTTGLSHASREPCSRGHRWETHASTLRHCATPFVTATGPGEEAPLVAPCPWSWLRADSCRGLLFHLRRFCWLGFLDFRVASNTFALSPKPSDSVSAARHYYISIHSVPVSQRGYNLRFHRVNGGDRVRSYPTWWPRLRQLLTGHLRQSRQVIDTIRRCCCALRR